MFVVDTLGRAEAATARVVRQTNADFGAALLAMLQKLRYEPARLNGTPVRQITSEKRSMGAFIVVVPAGSGLPSPAQMRGQLPRC